MTVSRWPTIRALVADLADPRLSGAACAGQAPLFDAEVPGETETARADRWSAAVRICRRCPVRADCTIVAAELGRSVTGVWAGQVRASDRQRRQDGAS